MVLQQQGINQQQHRISVSSDWTRRLKSSNITPEKQRYPQQAAIRTGKKFGGSNSVNYSPAKLPKLDKPS